MRKMSLCFTLTPVSEKPLNRYSKDMYKDMILEFVSKDYDLAEVLVEVNNKSYVKNMLQKSVEDLDMEHKVIVSIINNKCYLERY